MNFLQYWSSIAWYSKIFDILMSLFVLGAIGVGLYFLITLTIKFIKSLKLKGSVVVTKKGIKFQSEEKEGSGNHPQSSASYYLTQFMEERTIEINGLKDQLVKLQKRVQELENELLRKEAEESLKKGLLIPINQHQFFSNIITIKGQTLDFEKEDVMPKDKVFVVREFLNNCVLGTLYKNLKNFVTELESMKEDEKLQFLYSIQEKLFTWNDDIMEMAEELKITFPNGVCIHGVPICFLKQYASWYDKHFYVAFEKIRSTLFSSFYRTWQMRTIIMLDILDLLMLTCVEDARNSILMINGQFEKEIKEKVETARCKE